TIQFVLDRDIDAAAQDVNSAIASAARQLPATMPAPPSFRKVNPADFPVYYLALTSQALPLSTVNEYAETYLAQRISTINGVAQVLVFGQQKYAVRVQVDPNAMAARGVGINEIESAISNANVNLPTGTLYGKDRMFAVQATGQLNDAAAFRPVIVTYRNVSATIIPALALPMSIVGTFAVMYLFGYSLDNISLMALTLCVGFVVDDAIVMLENITRHIEQGKSVMQATLDGSKEIVFTII